MDETLLQFWTILGPIGILFFFAIREFFAYLKNKKGNGNTVNQSILDELQSQNNNHLHTMQDCMSDGFEKMIFKLDEIKEVLIRMDERDKSR
jgi:hypothetical protein